MVPGSRSWTRLGIAFDTWHTSSDSKDLEEIRWRMFNKEMDNVGINSIKSVSAVAEYNSSLFNKHRLLNI